MKHLYFFLWGSALAIPAAQAQDITNDGGTIALTDGATLYVTGGLTNKAGGTIDLGTAGQLKVGGNFVNTATIVPGTGAVQLVGSVAQVLDLGGVAPTGAGPTAATLYDLIVNNTATGTAVTVPSNLSVAHQLTLTSGQVRTAQTATVTLLQGATLTGETATRYVAGNLRAERSAVSGSSYVDFSNGARLNPSGTALGNVAIVRSAGLNTANVSYGVNPTDNAKRSIDQVWRVIPATQPSATTPVNVELTWLAVNDNGLTNFNSARMWRRESAGWLAVGPTVNASSRTLAGTVVGPLAQLTVSNDAAPLPVSLIAFSAERRGDAAQLLWRTASEKNNEYFGVEVSTDGHTFRQFARVAGQGNSTAPTDYTLADPALLGYRADVVYYRLRQVDFDGSVTYSPVAAVRVAAAGFAATAAPNPLGSAGTRIRITTATAGPAELALYDGTGRLQLGRRTELLAGTNEVALDDAGQLATGVYFLKISQGQQRTLLKLVRE